MGQAYATALSSPVTPTTHTPPASVYSTSRAMNFLAPC